MGVSINKIIFTILLLGLVGLSLFTIEAKNSDVSNLQKEIDICSLTASICQKSGYATHAKSSKSSRLKVVYNVAPQKIITSCEVADTFETRGRGLMYRKKLDKDGCMIFIYQAEESLSFWMKNTFIPLDIAFLNASQQIINIETMEPHNETPIHSQGLSQYAIEVNAGWFAKHNIYKNIKVDFVY